MSKKGNLTILWTKSASLSFKKAVTFISEDSTKAADNFKIQIDGAISAIPKNPERYPLDRFKNNSKGNYRAFELHSYRITYRITSSKIYIVRFRHVKMKPLLY